MAIDYTSSGGMMFPKSRPKALLKADKDAVREKQDREENAKVKARAGGRCEVLEVERYRAFVDSAVCVDVARCIRKDSQTHHLISGSGRRNRGDSVLATQKLRVCDKCHEDITRHILQPTTAVHDASTVRYRRVR